MINLGILWTGIIRYADTDCNGRFRSKAYSIVICHTFSWWRLETCYRNIAMQTPLP